MTETVALAAVEPGRRRHRFEAVIPLSDWKAKSTTGG
jgi:hypothetical protein